MKTLTLEPQTAVCRKISSTEYYHAAAGTSPRTLEQPRNSIMIIEGQGDLLPEKLQLALQRAADVNPGARMRLTGQRQNTCWTTDAAAYPHFRVIDNCVWDGTSNVGMEFANETVLSLQTGPIAELIFVRGVKTFIIFRVSHAAMDGVGMLHFLREIFRALRNEALVGSNAAFSDVELMQSVAQAHWRNASKAKPIPLTGGARGSEIGDDWRRLTMPLTKHNNVAAIVAELSARYAQRFADQAERVDDTVPANRTVRIAVPVNLRRHLPDLVSTMNFTGLLHIDLEPNEGADQFRKKMKELLKAKRDVAQPPGVGWLCHIPLHWIDYLTGRRRANYLRRNLVETVMITNFGKLDLREFSCDYFVATNFFSLPIAGNSFISLYACGENTNAVIGMPKVYASAGRMDEFCVEIIKALNPSDNNPLK